MWNNDKLLEYIQAAGIPVSKVKISTTMRAQRREGGDGRTRFLLDQPEVLVYAYEQYDLLNETERDDVARFLGSERTPVLYWDFWEDFRDGFNKMMMEMSPELEASPTFKAADDLLERMLDLD